MNKIIYEGDYFYSFRDGMDANIQIMIDETVKKMTKENFEYYMTATGNSIVIGMKYDNEIQIIASKDYCEATLLHNDDKWEPICYEKRSKLC